MDAEVSESATSAKPDRTLLAVLLVVGLLVAIALVVVLVRSTVRESLDPSTPEGVVQRYAQAVIDGDDETAADYLTGRSSDCDYYDRGSTNVRLTFQSSKITGSKAVVRVSISSSYGGDPFSNYEYSYDDEFRLVKSGDSWLIETAPYEFLSCGGN
jgi:hypothetical protein